MNRPELYQKTVDVLLDAYNSDSLFHGLCSACAVGNICAEASIQTGVPNWKWKNLFYTAGIFGQVRSYRFSSEQAMQVYGESEEQIQAKREEAYRLIEATGYTVDELADIEAAFEAEPTSYIDDEELDRWRDSGYISQAPFYDTIKREQFNGLVRVLDKLKKIHEVDQDESQANQTRLETIAATKFELV